MPSPSTSRRCRWSRALWLLLLVLSFGLIAAHNYQGLSDCSPAATAADPIHQKPGSTPRALIVSTLDGRVHALDVNNKGRLLWSRPLGQGPLLESTLGSIDFHHNQVSFRLIPSLDGTLYRYNGQAVEPLPLNTEKLLQNDYRLGDDVTISGGKEASSFGLDLMTGESRYECDTTGCFPSDLDTTTAGSDDGNHSQHHRHLLLVERQTQVVRAHSPSTGIENWSFKVGDFQIYLVNQNRNCRMSTADDDLNQSRSQSDRFRIMVPDGFISLVDQKDNRERWKAKFSAPIVGAWEFSGGKNLHQLDLFSMNSDRSPDSAPTLYLGSHRGQIYVQHSLLYKKALKSDPTLSLMPTVTDLAGGIDDPKRLAIGWQPQPIDDQYSPASSDLDTDIVEVTAASTAVSVFPGMSASELERGFLLPVIIQKPTADQNLDEPGCRSEEEEDQINNISAMPIIVGEEFNETLSIDSMGMEQVIFVSLWYWWREIMAVSLLLAAVINIVIYHIKHNMDNCAQRRLEREQQISLDDQDSHDVDGADDDPDKMPSLDPGQSRRPLSLQLSQISVDTGTGTSTLTNSTAGSVGDTIFQPPSYKSRYMAEFTHVKCLGRGGFGVVFEATHNLDRQSYAIKRIKVKLNSREKVLREVIALAKLDHPGIVRFYSTWLENPPAGWQEDLDKGLNLTKTGSEMDSMATDTKFTTETTTDIRSGSTFNTTASAPTTRQRYPTVTKGQLDDSLRAPEAVTMDGDDSDSYVCFENSQQGDLVLDSPTAGADEGPESRTNISIIESSDLSTNYGRVLPVKSLDQDQKNLYFQQPAAFLYIQMQLCKKLTLREWLQRSNKLVHRDSTTVLDLFRQIVEAVDYIHCQDLIHRDLKPSNILFASNGAVKIGDFGLVTNSIAEPTEIRTPTDGPGGDTPASNRSLCDTPKQYRRQRHSHTDNVGTCLYMSPEQIAGQSYSNKVDIFSLGVIYFELLTPFKTDMERIISLKSVRDSVFPRNFEKDRQFEHNLLKELLATNAEHRPAAHEIRRKLPSLDHDHDHDLRRERFSQRLRTFSETLNEADEFDCSS